MEQRVHTRPIFVPRHEGHSAFLSQVEDQIEALETKIAVVERMLDEDE